MIGKKNKIIEELKTDLELAVIHKWQSYDYIEKEFKDHIRKHSVMTIDTSDLAISILNKAIDDAKYIHSGKVEYQEFTDCEILEKVRDGKYVLKDDTDFEILRKVRDGDYVLKDKASHES